MPMLDFDETPSRGKATPRKSLKFILGIGLIAGSISLGSTLAADINLNSGAPVEFGQGMAVTAACSGSSVLTATPNSSFVNASGSGSFYFKSVTVTGIPNSCYGKDFQISAFDDSAGTTALPIFNGTQTTATVYNNAGTFEAGFQSTGSTVSSTSGSFIITFTTPVALASNVNKLTLQSTEHREWTCALGGPCTPGDVGPGGGYVFFARTTSFNCGPTLAAQCNYLEAAPGGWNGGDDPTARWIRDQYAYTPVNGTNGMINDWLDNNYSSIGRGYINSRAITQMDNATSIAASVARSYRGGGLSDWYLPNYSEMNTLCMWNVGNTPEVGRCEPNQGLNKPRFGAQFSRMMGGFYWTSSERMFQTGGSYTMSDSENYGSGKHESLRIRPVRAF